MCDIFTLLLKNAWHFANSISNFQNAGRLSYAGVHGEAHQKCVNALQDAGRLVTMV